MKLIPWNERKPGDRPKCLWQVPGGPNPTVNHGTVDCGSTEELYRVKGNRLGAYEAPVCIKHLADAFKHWDADSAEPIV